MVTWRPPSAERIQAFLEAQSRFELTYVAPAGSSGEPPAGYVVDRTSTPLGQGAETFARARKALESWAQFDLGWASAWPTRPPIREGEMVAIVVHLLGRWWTSACRIVRVVDEPEGPIARYGFAYGTMPDHAGSGEERFLIEWDHATDEVRFEILAFSRPQWLAARLAYPYMRRLQKQFGREASASLRRAVAMSHHVDANRPAVTTDLSGHPGSG
jgi:uncharacterized protein (UPF0548 family)